MLKDMFLYAFLQTKPCPNQGLNDCCGTNRYQNLRQVFVMLQSVARSSVMVFVAVQSVDRSSGQVLVNIQSVDRGSWQVFVMLQEVA
jgi:hypothetical protein